MSISCKQCQAKLKLAPSSTPKRIQCPRCGKLMTVPATSPIAVGRPVSPPPASQMNTMPPAPLPDAQQPAPVTSTTSSPTDQKRTPIGLLIGLGAGLLVLLVAGSAIGIMLGSSAASAPAAVQVNDEEEAEVIEVVGSSTDKRIGSRAFGGRQVVEFMGSEAEGERFCIIADVSGSMATKMTFKNQSAKPKRVPRIAFLKKELEKTLGSLAPDNSFFVVLYDTDAEAQPGGRWMKGRQVHLIDDWLKSIRPRGGTKPLPAFKIALQLQPKPDVIFFMTDGQFSPDVARRIANMNRTTPKVLINTIQLSKPRDADLSNPAYVKRKLQGFTRQKQKLLRKHRKGPPDFLKPTLKRLADDIDRYRRLLKHGYKTQMETIAEQSGGKYRLID